MDVVAPSRNAATHHNKQDTKKRRQLTNELAAFSARYN